MVIRNRPGAGDPAPSLPPALEDIPEALLDDPLAYLFADHFRHRAVCARLRQFAQSGDAMVAEAREAAKFLGGEYELHHADEDEDLFPALLRRALPEDELAPVIARLSADHRYAVECQRRILAALARRDEAGRIRFGPRLRRALADFASRETNHLAIENGIVLAIARIRLTKSDLAAIAQSMRARRRPPRA
jgi:hypothetical protein